MKNFLTLWSSLTISDLFISISEMRPDFKVTSKLIWTGFSILGKKKEEQFCRNSQKGFMKWYLLPHTCDVNIPLLMWGILPETVFGRMFLQVWRRWDFRVFVGLFLIFFGSQRQYTCFTYKKHFVFHLHSQAILKYMGMLTLELLNIFTWKIPLHMTRMCFDFLSFKEFVKFVKKQCGKLGSINKSKVLFMDVNFKV